jgi:hypothetical protein
MTRLPLYRLLEKFYAKLRRRVVVPGGRRQLPGCFIAID